VAIGIRDPNTDPDPYRNTGETCLGRGIDCPSASSLRFYHVFYAFQCYYYYYYLNVFTSMV